MRKQEFLSKLKRKISRIPKNELNERLNFYSEMIDDRVEAGFSEEEAVARIGTVEDVASQVLREYPSLIDENKKIVYKNNWLLIGIGSPLWIPLLIAVFAIVLSLYIVLWSVVISIWAVFVSFAAVSVASPIIALIYIGSNFGYALGFVGIGIAFFGLTVLTYYGAKGLSIASVKLGKYLLTIFKSKKKELEEK